MQPSHLSAKPGTTDGVSSCDAANSSSYRRAPDGVIRNAPQGNPPRTTPRRFDDWSPLYELDSASSYSPASTESQDTPRDTSVSSCPGEATSKPAIPGIPLARTASREKQSHAPEPAEAVVSTIASAGKQLSPVTAEQPPAGSPHFSSLDKYARPTSVVSFSSETKPTQHAPASASDYPISILKKPAVASSSSSESPIKSPPTESSDLSTNSALTTVELRRSTKLLGTVSHVKEAPADSAISSTERSRTTPWPSKLSRQGTDHQNAKGRRLSSLSFPKSTVGPLIRAESQSRNIGRESLEAVTNTKGAKLGEKRSQFSSQSSAGAREEEESSNLSPSAATSKPSRSATKWKRLFIEPSDRRMFWRTLTESDTGTAVDEKPQNSSAEVILSGSAPVTGSDPKAVDQNVDPESVAGAGKKVLLVSASDDTNVDVALAAPQSPYGGTNVKGLESDESSSSETEAEVASQASTQIQFRPVPPKESAEFRRSLAQSKRGEERATTTLWKTSVVGRFTTSMSTAFRDIIVMATTRRFFMLTVFCVATLMPSFQWIQYSIVSNIIEQYYGESSTAVSWTAMIYYVAYITMAIPCAWVLDSYGLRVTVLCGACGSAIGSCIKLFSIGHDRFAYVLIGQVFPAIATAFTSAVPARLASAWFKYEEISTASSAGLLGIQLGYALGFFVPPHVLDKGDVEESLRSLCIGVAIASSLAFLVVIACFEEKPTHPPSFSEMLNRYADTRTSFGEGMHKLIRDRNFILLLLSYGINTGSLYSISTMLNPVITNYFPGEEGFAGILGLSLTFCGLLGSWVCGVVVDKTAKFKEVTLVAYIFSAIAMLLHTFVLRVRSHSLTMAACLLLGFFMTGYMPLGVQLGAEITYPLNEALPASLLSMSAQGTSLVLTPICNLVRAEFGNVACNLVVSGMLVIGCILTALLHAELKRQKAYMRVQRKRSTPAARAVSGGAPSSISEEVDAETERSRDTASSL